MARPLRIEYPGAWYHVTCRGNERKPVFKYDSDPRVIVGFNELLDKPVTMEGIARRVAAHFGIEERDLYPRNAPFKLVRSIFMEQCCFYLSRKMALFEIARRLGSVAVSAFSQNRRRLSSRMA